MKGATNVIKPTFREDLKFTSKTCQLCRLFVRLEGSIVLSEDVKKTQLCFSAMKDFQSLLNQRQRIRILDLAECNRQVIPAYASFVEPLHRFKGIHIFWIVRKQSKLEEPTLELLNGVVLAMPVDDKFIPAAIPWM